MRLPAHKFRFRAMVEDQATESNEGIQTGEIVSGVVA